MTVFLHFEVQIELLPQSCALFVGNVPISRPEPTETETLLRRPHEPKTVNSIEFTRFGSITLLYCFHTRTALAHNVADMLRT